jgi:hypothetical protein
MRWNRTSRRGVIAIEHGLTDRAFLTAMGDNCDQKWGSAVLYRR